MTHRPSYAPQRLAVLHLNQIGDLLFSLPLLHAVRKQWPQATLVSVVRPHLGDLIAAAEVVDDVVVLPAKGSAWAVSRALRRGGFDLAIALSGSHAQVLGAYLARVRRRVGFADAALPMLLTSRAAGRGVPCLAKMATMARHLGCQLETDSYVGLIRPRHEQLAAARRLLTAAGVRPGEQLAALGPGWTPGHDHKAWRADGFAAVADGLEKRFGLSPLILGRASDRRRAEEISRLSPAAVLNLAGSTTTGEAMAVLSACAVFVGGDSGLMHLAAALDIPVVALFGPTDPELTGPRCSASAIIRKDLPCSPCHDPACRHRECMMSIHPEEVLDVISRMLHAVGRDGVRSPTAASGARPADLAEPSTG
jgi:heptosyltransferase-2